MPQTRIVNDRTLADARWMLLQFLARDMRCSAPDEVQRDCGKCLRCCMIYREGALEFSEATGGYVLGQRLDPEHEQFVREL